MNVAAGRSVILLAESNTWQRIFGLDAQTLFDTAVVLVAMLVLFILLSYLLFNPARELIKKRQDLIARDMDEAKKQREEADEYKAEYDNKLKNVAEEANELINNARRKAKKQEDEIIAEAKEEAGRIVSRAEKDIILEKNKARDEMKQEIIAVASLMTEKFVTDSMDEAKQKELFEDALGEIGEETWQS